MGAKQKLEWWSDSIHFSQIVTYWKRTPVSNKNGKPEIIEQTCAYFARGFNPSRLSPYDTLRFILLTVKTSERMANKLSVSSRLQLDYSFVPLVDKWKLSI
jgi:hypothetical protein